MALRETLELDVAKALQGIDRIEAELAASAQRFKVGLADALSVLNIDPVKVEADAREVTTDIDRAVDAADTAVTVAETDASGVTTDISSAVDAADTSVTVADVDARSVTAGIDTAINAADSTVTISETDTGNVTASINEAVRAADTSITIEADTSGLQGAQGDIGATDIAAGRLLGTVGAVGGSLRTLGPAALAFATGVGAKALIDFGIDSVEVASALEEQVSATTVVFGEAEGTIRDFASTSATSLGLAEDQTLRLSNSLGGLLTALDLTEEQAADFGTSMIQRAADVASLLDVAGGGEEVLQAFQSAIVGEAEPVRRFGVVINEATVAAKALELGIGGVGKELTDTEKVQARYALILEGTSVAAGNFADTADSLANSQRSLTAEFRNTQSELGKKLLPDAKELVSVARADLIPALDQFAEATLPLVTQALETVIPILVAAADAASVFARGVQAVEGPLKFAARGATFSLAPLGAFKGLLGDSGKEAKEAAPKIDNLARAELRIAGETAKTAEATATQAKEMEALQTRISDVTGGLTAQQVALNELGPSAAALFDEFARGTPTAERFKALQDELGLSEQTLLGVFGEVTGAITDVVDAYTSGIPTITEATKGLAEDTNITQYVDNLQKEVLAVANFVDNIVTLQQRGATRLAATLAEQGVSRAKEAETATTLNQRRLADEEAQFVATEATRTAATTALEEAGKRDVAARQKTNADLAGVPPPDLSTKLTTAINTASLDFQGRLGAFQRDAAAGGAKVGQDTALSTATGLTDNAFRARVALNEARDSFLEGVSDVQRQAAAGGSDIALDFTDAFAIGIANRADRAAEEAARMAQRAVDSARARLRAFSPSRVMIDLGGDVAEGLALGIAADIGMVEAAAERMALAAIPSLGSVTAPAVASVVVADAVVRSAGGTASAAPGGPAVVVGSGGTFLRIEATFGPGSDQEGVTEALREFARGELTDALGRVKMRVDMQGSGR